MLFVCLGMFCHQRLGLEKDFPHMFFVRLFSSTRVNVETLGLLISLSRTSTFALFAVHSSPSVASGRRNNEEIKRRKKKVLSCSVYV